MLKIHEFMIKKHKSDFSKSDVATMLIKLTILDANLKKDKIDSLKEVEFSAFSQ